MVETCKNVSFLENVLPKRIIADRPELSDFQVVKCSAINCKSLDGFLSMTYRVRLHLKDYFGVKKTLNLFAKLLKEASSFDDGSNIAEMTFNELVFYIKVLPCFEDAAKNATIDNLLTPKFYYGFYDYDKDLNDGKTIEGVFVFEDLASEGFRMGPREHLDETHILLMTDAIAKLHAASYAVKLQNREKFDELVGAYKAFPFTGEQKTFSDAFYNIALERLMRHVKTTDQPQEYREAVSKIYKKFIERPSKLLQEFLAGDDDFNIIIHGDYNRNNVMFCYEQKKSFEDPKDIKMFDFQWTKYASPVLDLSFYLYMNLDPEILEGSWQKILHFYHESLIASLMKMLKCDESDLRLERLSFPRFLDHFSKFAFYGCLISTWFLPCMMSDQETIRNIEIEVNKDMNSEALMAVCMRAGAPNAMIRVNSNVKHAFDNGYLKRLLD